MTYLSDFVLITHIHCNANKRLQMVLLTKGFLQRRQKPIFYFGKNKLLAIHRLECMFPS